MGTVIRAGSRFGLIIRDVRYVVARAASEGEAFQQDAERFLRQPLDRAEELASQLEEVEHELDGLAAEEEAEAHRCHDLVGAIKDHLWNLTGRTRHDPVFQQLFPGGFRLWVATSPADRPAALELFATLLETVPHPRIPPEEVASATDRVRAAAASLATVTASLVPVRTRKRLLDAQSRANTNHAQRQLVNLKRYWIAMGIAEVDVHRIIPSRTPKARAAASTESPLVILVDEDTGPSESTPDLEAEAAK